MIGGRLFGLFGNLCLYDFVTCFKVFTVRACFVILPSVDFVVKG